MPIFVVLSCVAACSLCGIDLFSCKALSVFTINLLTYLLTDLLMLRLVVLENHCSVTESPCVSDRIKF